MADQEITVEQLMKKQEAMAKRMIALSAEENAGNIVAVGAELQAEAAELEKLCMAFKAQEEAKAGPKTRQGITTVVLTPAQRQRVLQETGVDMLEVDVRDDSSRFVEGMPVTQPPSIEEIALAEARGRKALELAEEKARADANALFERAIGLGVPGLAEQIERAKQDPNFLCGLFHKKSQR